RACSISIWSRRSWRYPCDHGKTASSIELPARRFAWVRALEHPRRSPAPSSTQTSGRGSGSSAEARATVSGYQPAEYVGPTGTGKSRDAGADCADGADVVLGGVRPTTGPTAKSQPANPTSNPYTRIRFIRRSPTDTLLGPVRRVISAARKFNWSSPELRSDAGHPPGPRSSTRD